MIHYITSQGIGQPWVANELRIVDGAGVPFRLYAMRRPEAVHFSSPWARAINGATRVIYPLPLFGTAISLLVAPVFFGRRFFGALGNALFAPREDVRGRIASVAHFGVACHWARSLRRERVSLIHSQWAFSSATIGMYGAWLLAVPFSFTGHASDLFRNRVALEDKIRRADFIICISEFHREFYREHGARDEQLHVAYCGIDVKKFAPASEERRPDGVLRIRSSGRLVEKKGFEYLIEACKLLAERNVPFECVIGGSGPLEGDLRNRLEGLGLSDRVQLTGRAITQEELPVFMHSGDLYCLPCVWARDNDVDGLPQMLMEAMACGLPTVSTRLVGIPDLVVDGETGCLVEPRNASELADAIERLYRDPQEMRRLAEAGRRWVMERFDIDRSLEPLIRQFKAKLGAVERERSSTESPEGRGAVSGRGGA